MGELAGIQRGIRRITTVCIAVSVETAAFAHTFSSIRITSKSPTQLKLPVYLYSSLLICKYYSLGRLLESWENPNPSLLDTILQPCLLVPYLLLTLDTTPRLLFGFRFKL